MSRKTFISILALLLVFSISLVGCSNQESMSPAEDSEPKDSEVVQHNGENEEGIEEQSDIKEEKQAETKYEEEKTEEVGEVQEASEDAEDNRSLNEESNEENISESNAGGSEETNTESLKEHQENVVYISVNRLNVRTDSRADSKTLGSLGKGNEVTVIEEVKNEETTWYKIRYENAEGSNEGWVSSEYTVKDIHELLSSPTIFQDEEMNTYFTSSTLFDDHTVIAYYGHPNSEIMGIVGRHSKEELISLLQKTSEKYDAVNEDKSVIPAIYLVYGTVQPRGEISTMSFDLVMSYIETAYKNGVLVYLDHQIGKHDPVNAINETLPFLRFPNVHLAIDPEWRTDKPMKEVGYVTGEELNAIQNKMREYMTTNEIEGKRQLVFHQFLDSMIHDIEAVSVDYDPVWLVHNTSGWGPPEGKIATHTRNAKATNIPYKGFKLWYFYSNKPGVHFDNPLMTPEQVLELNPAPGLIIYQ
ncbi:SH3 domain-containing protein [Bacillus sp. HMF5848]|uniref:SH3 domain-containing protein n=1 Tax=Bacillus sp. HMF5848 TaxID=2495421 RepID=UPI001639D6A2|nr:SH3 domain-containing protein [Bacillus sp. HMF5848]